MREYYTAYDDRYRAVHASGLQWASDTPTALIAGIIRELRLSPGEPILELGCGEGRDAAALMGMGYDVAATDVSEEAVKWCKGKYPEHSGSFAVLDCVNGTFPGRFRLIYSVAVLHMLTEDRHRAAFWRFVRDHLSPGGHALVLAMGDGTDSRRSDPKAAFDTSGAYTRPRAEHLMWPPPRAGSWILRSFGGRSETPGLSLSGTGLLHMSQSLT